MVDIDKLKKPPIIEAIVQIAFESPSLKEVKALKSFFDTLKPDYTDIKEIVSISLESFFHEQKQVKQTNPELTLNGYIINNKSNPKHIVLTSTSISLNHKKPYTSWDSMIKDFKEIWKKFCNFLPDLQVNKLSLRYVNRIDLDITSSKGVYDFFNLFPKIPSEILTPINQHSLQVEVPHKNKELIAKITQVIKPCSNVENKIHCNLDIEINKDTYTIDEDIWLSFSKMRDFKNEIFFSSITEKTKAQFQ